MNKTMFAVALVTAAVLLANPVAASSFQEEGIRVEVRDGGIFIETEKMIVAVDGASAGIQLRYPGSGDWFTMIPESILCFNSGDDSVFADSSPVYEALLGAASWRIVPPVSLELPEGGAGVSMSLLAVVDAVQPAWLPTSWLPPFVPVPTKIPDWAEVNITLTVATVERTFVSASGSHFTVERLHEFKVDVSVDQQEILGLDTLAVSYALKTPKDRDGFRIVLEQAGGPVVVAPGAFASADGIPEYLPFAMTDEGKQVAYVANADEMNEAFFAWALWADEVDTGLELPISAHYYVTEDGVKLLLSATGISSSEATVLFDPSVGIIPETYEYLRELFMNNLESFAIGAAAAAGIVLVVFVVGTRKSEKRTRGLSLEHNKFLRKRD